MKKIAIITTLLISSFVYSQTPCVGGFAGIYPCNKIDLMAQMDFPAIGGNNTTEGNDCWGWTDPLNGKEYAIMGCTSHTAFIDITIPTAPVYKGKINGHNNSVSLWREMKVYNNHVYIVSEANGHGMQIFDLTRLRNVTTPQTFLPDARYTGFGSCHTISINEQTGFAYGNGSNTFQGGLHIVNIQNPTNPVFVSGSGSEGYTHDSQIVIYNGPDPDHQGKEIFIGANQDKVSIIDVTNKLNPVVLSNFTYDNVGYTHQGWFTPDQKYWLLGDETDEDDFGFNTRTIIVDLTDLDNPTLKGEYIANNPSIDHNGYTLGNEFYLSSYTGGIRLLNTSNINSFGTMNEIGFFDTYPASNNAQFNGVWSVYPYFPSGSIIISDIDRGLFIVRKNASLDNENFISTDFEFSPNPATNFFTINSTIEIEKVTIFDALGKVVKEYQNSESYDTSDLFSGFYFVKVNDLAVKKLIIN
jgi:choice-of-anchor B domain-containing protein